MVIEYNRLLYLIPPKSTDYIKYSFSLVISVLFKKPHKHREKALSPFRSYSNPTKDIIPHFSDFLKTTERNIYHEKRLFGLNHIESGIMFKFGIQIFSKD